MESDGTLAPWNEADICAVCPGNVHGPGHFDVADGVASNSRYDTSTGYRRDTTTGTPVCVHPEKIGIPPGRYASAGEPFPTTEPTPEPPGQIPEDPLKLTGWMTAVVRYATADELTSALAQAEAAASAKFEPDVVLVALRAALGAS